MGLEKIFLQVIEDVGVVDLCIVVHSPFITCPIPFPFHVRLSTGDGTAGKVPV